MRSWALRFRTLVETKYPSSPVVETRLQDSRQTLVKGIKLLVLLGVVSVGEVELSTRQKPSAARQVHTVLTLCDVYCSSSEAAPGPSC